jgi:hypothetical protein
MFETRSGVTALDFSRHQPSVLAVGLYDGTVAMYDVKVRRYSFNEGITAINQPTERL